MSTTHAVRARSKHDKAPVELAQAADGVAVISYNRPEKSNSLDAAVSRGLLCMLGILDRDAATSSVVVTGRGSYFCAAAKFDEMLGPVHPSVLASQISIGDAEIFRSFVGFGKPIVAAINGPAFGGGVTQVTLCDMGVSASTAKFSVPFSSWRVSPEGCSSVHLARVAGRLVAGRLMVDAWTPNASQAKTIGLVSSFVEPQALLGAASTALRNLLRHDHVRSVGTILSSAEVHHEYRVANLIESIALGDSCLSPPFLQIQKSH